MTMMLNIDDKYISKFKSFIASLPQGTVEMKGSLDDEILQRVSEYKKTLPRLLYLKVVLTH